MKDYIKDILLSVNRGFPFVAIETANYQLTLTDLRDGLAEQAKENEKPVMALLHHDMIRGARATNGTGVASADAMNSTKGELRDPEMTTAKIEECLGRALDLMPSNSILVIDDIHLLFEHRDETIRALYIQCVRNCREAFKSSERALVFLVPKFKPPVELAKDIDIVVAPMPGEEDRIEMARIVCKAAGVPIPAPESLVAASGVLRGLTAFGAENLLAMSLTKENGFDFNILKRGSVAAVNAVPGLSVIEGKMKMEDLVGLEQCKKYGRMKAAGKMKPTAVVLMDELSDQQAGENDSNGINRDARSVMLSAMQDNDWRGAIFSGVAGTGKTQMAGAIANECGAMFINWDQGAMKGGIVSESEKMIRNAVSTLWERFGRDVFFIGSTNSVEEIAPQMKRRFGAIFFFDVLSSDQQKPIWTYYRKKFNIPAENRLPEHSAWTGAEIERCAEIAWEFGIPLVEAAQFISPVVMSMGDKLDAMREGASGKYLSADTPGYFTTKRAMDLKKMRALINDGEPRDINLN